MEVLRTAKTNRFLIALIVILPVGFAGYCLLFWPWSDASEGWTPETLQKAFLPGIITNGLPPADFEATLESPTGKQDFKLKPSETLKVLVNVKMTGKPGLNEKVPPTFVRLMIQKKIASNVNNVTTPIVRPDASTESSQKVSGASAITGNLTSSISGQASDSSVKSTVSSIVMDPNAVSGRTYVYSCSMVSPKKTGDYRIVLEVEYVAHDFHTGEEPKARKPTRYLKAFTLGILHVTK